MSISVVGSRGRNDQTMQDPSYASGVAGRAARLSKIGINRFAVCPIYPNMFSELQNYPRKQYVIRQETAPTFVEKLQGDTASQSHASRQQILGSDRYKYFHNSPVQSNQTRPDVPQLDLNCFYKVDRDRLRRKQEQEAREKRANTKNIKVQTVYRETSAQTSPWEPDYTVVEGNPEILLLDFLKWGEGLPAGEDEVQIILRQRAKRKWEASIPCGTSKESFERKREMIEQMSRTEWADRERDIEEIQQLRLELLEKMLNELHEKSLCRNEQKLRMFADMKLSEKRDKIAKIKKDAEREKRRLRFQYTGILQKYGKVNVFEAHADLKSEMYCPLMRHGTNPKYRNEELCAATNSYKAQFSHVEEFDTLPRQLQDGIHFDDREVKLLGRRLCIKQTKWTLPVLKALYTELLQMRVKDEHHPNLRVCVQHIMSLPPTPEFNYSAKNDVEKHAAAVLLQKVLRGRAAQNKIFIGRERCHELIDELRGNYALLKGEVCKKAFLRDKRKEEQLNANRCMANMKTLEGSLKKLSGSVTGTLLDFLNKDLQRLLRERRAHAMILLVERLRQIRESEEAGRRQKEMRRRCEHDEIFKQVVKVHQDTVDLYLQDIITEGMQFTSEQRAQEYVQSMAVKIADEQDAVEKAGINLNREEFISQLMHNFVIPEVEKDIVRERMEAQQKKYLRAAHDEIYRTIERSPKPQETSSLSTESSIAPSATLTGSLTRTKPSDTLQKSKESERQTVLKDIQSILDDLVAIPYKQSALTHLIPCGNKEVTPDETIEVVIEEDAEEEGGEEEAEHEPSVMGDIQDELIEGHVQQPEAEEVAEEDTNKEDE